MRLQIIGSFLLVFCVGILPATAMQYPPVPGPEREAGPPAQNLPPQDQQGGGTLPLPAGTLVTVRLTEQLSSDHNRSGDSFTAILDQPLISQGLVVSRRGQTVVGRVAAAQKAGRAQGVSQLAVELNELVLVDGQQVPIRTQLIQSSAGTSRGRDIEGVSTTTGMGAIIGAAAGGGKGAAIGAAAGAVAGVAGILSTRGRSTELYPETVLTFRLLDPVYISTDRSLQAFRPVSREDYPERVALRNPPRHPIIESAPPPPYYYSPYYYPSYYPPYRFYGYYGYGPRLYVSPRIYFGRGYYRHR